MGEGARSEQDIPAIPPRAEVQVVTHIRSTLLMSPQATLREAALYDRYVALLPESRREQITQLGAPTWLPLSTGLVHYQACDQLGLDEEAVISMAQRVAMHREGSFLGV